MSLSSCYVTTSICYCFPHNITVQKTLMEKCRSTNDFLVELMMILSSIAAQPHKSSPRTRLEACVDFEWRQQPREEGDVPDSSLAQHLHVVQCGHMTPPTLLLRPPCTVFCRWCEAGRPVRCSGSSPCRPRPKQGSV